MKLLILALVTMLISCNPPSDRDAISQEYFRDFMYCEKSKISNNCFCCMRRTTSTNSCSYGDDSLFVMLPCNEAEKGFGFKVKK